MAIMIGFNLTVLYNRSINQENLGLLVVWSGLIQRHRKVLFLVALPAGTQATQMVEFIWVSPLTINWSSSMVMPTIACSLPVQTLSVPAPIMGFMWIMMAVPLAFPVAVPPNIFLVFASNKSTWPQARSPMCLDHGLLQITEFQVMATEDKCLLVPNVPNNLIFMVVCIHLLPQR